MQNKKKLLIFGAKGFVGSTLCDYVDRSRYDLIKAVHGKEIESDSISVDISKADEVKKTVESVRPDYIINLAGIHSIADTEKDIKNAIDINVCGSVNIMEAIKIYSPNSKLLLIGSSEEYDSKQDLLSESDLLKPRNMYGMTKLWQEYAAELYARMDGVKVICTRSFNHTGINQKTNTVISSFCQQAAEIALGIKEPYLFTGNLDVERDFLDVRDVVAAYIKLLESDINTGIFNVCSGRKIRLSDLLGIIVGFTGKNVEICTDPARVRRNDIPIIVGNNDKLKHAVSWMPNCSLEGTLKEIYELKIKNLIQKMENSNV